MLGRIRSYNGIARTLKKLRTSKGDYWIKQRLSSIASLFKMETSLKGKKNAPTENKFYLLRAAPYWKKGAQWLSGRVLDSRPKGRGFEPHRRQCVVVLEQDTIILA